MRLPPGRLMMPPSFAGLISGMLTLVATPLNLVVDSALKRNGFAGFGLLSFTPFGLAILVAGISYMLVVRRWLGVKADERCSERSRRNLLDLIEQYDLAGPRVPSPYPARFSSCRTDIAGIVKVGVPFALLAMLISVTLVPLLFPPH